MTKNHSIMLLIWVCTWACVATSCRKKQMPPPPYLPPVVPLPPTSYNDYMPMRPGSYWIYEFYALDSANGAAHATGRFDSAYVAADTTINFRRYHTYFYHDYFSPEYQIRYQQDSLQYTVDSKGLIILATRDFKSVFRTYQFGPNAAVSDTIKVTEQMGNRYATTVVPAGSFMTISFLEVFHLPPGSPYGTERIKEHVYARNIGLVKETSGFYFSTPQVYEKRLVRYYLANKR